MLAAVNLYPSVVSLSSGAGDKLNTLPALYTSLVGRASAGVGRGTADGVGCAGAL